MTDATKQKPRPYAWAMRIPGCDGSADWVEIGEQEPAPCPPAVAHPLYDQDAIDRLTADRDSWMQQASDRAQDALDLVAAERKHWRTLLSPQHVFRGSCPDAQNWHDRDPECPACRALGDWTA